MCDQKQTELDLIRLGFRIKNTETIVPALVPVKTRYFLGLCDGRHAPLSFALLELNLAVLLPMDADELRGGALHDILDDQVHDFLLRLAWSGVVALVHAAAPCSKHSIMRNYPGGPPPVRTKEFMDGWDGMSPAQLEENQSSRKIHLRAAGVVVTTYTMGGHGSWETPPTSLAVIEECNMTLFDKLKAFFIMVTSCPWGWRVGKKKVVGHIL